MRKNIRISYVNWGSCHRGREDDDDDVDVDEDVTDVDDDADADDDTNDEGGKEGGKGSRREGGTCSHKSLTTTT